MTPQRDFDAPTGESTTGRTVVGLFSNRHHAEAAIRDLKAADFRDEQIGVAMQDVGEQRELMDTTSSNAAEGAAKGAVSGGVVGGLIGLLGSLLVPGVGPVIVGGVLASTLTGAGIGAATGGLIGALIGLGVPEEDARHFDQGLRSGGTLVTVDAGSRTGDALAILQRHEVDFGPSRGRRFGGWDTEAGAAEGLGSAGLGNEVASESSTGTRGMSPPGRRPYAGRERRTRRDTSYRGPERRLIGV
ncbi:MAG: general stress protein [Gemmatimonadales bacterium]